MFPSLEKVPSRLVRSTSVRALVLLGFLLVGCIPTTETEITIASGNDVTGDAERVRALVTGLGLAEYKDPVTRGMRNDSSETKRTNYETVPTTAIGILVIEEATKGIIRIIFTERKTQFSRLGLERRDLLIRELRGAFKEKVVAVRDSGV